MNIQEFRNQYPEYNDMADSDLAESLYSQFYTDMPRGDFDKMFLTPIAQPDIDAFGTSESLNMFSPEALGDFAKDNATTLGALATSTVKAPNLLLSALTGLTTAAGGLIESGGGEPSAEDMALMEQGLPMVTGKTLKDFGAGAGAEMLGGLIVKGGEKTLKAGTGLLEKSRELGLPQMPFREGRLNDWIANMVDLFPGSALMTNRYAKKVNDWALTERDTFARIFSSEIPAREEVGEKVGKALIGNLQGDVAKYKNLYGEFAAADVEIPVSKETRHLVHKLIGSAGEADKSTLKRYLLDQDAIVTADINRLFGGKGGGGIADRGIKDEIKKAVYSDIKMYDDVQGPVLEKIRTEADNTYKLFLAKLNDNPKFQRILRAYDPMFSIPGSGIKKNPMMNPRPDLVIRKIFESGNIDEIKGVQAALPDDVWNMSFARYIEDHLANATDVSGKVLYPSKWVGEWDQMKKVVRGFAPDVADRMQTWTDMIVKAEPYLAAQTPGEATKQLFSSGLKMFAGGGPASGLAFQAGGIPGLAAANVFPMIMAHSFLGPQGKQLIRKYAASPFQRQVTKAATVEALR